MQNIRYPQFILWGSFETSEELPEGNKTGSTIVRYLDTSFYV